MNANTIRDRLDKLRELAALVAKHNPDNLFGFACHGSLDELTDDEVRWAAVQRKLFSDHTPKGFSKWLAKMKKDVWMEEFLPRKPERDEQMKRLTDDGLLVMAALAVCVINVRDALRLDEDGDPLFDSASSDFQRLDGALVSTGISARSYFNAGMHEKEARNVTECARVFAKRCKASGPESQQLVQDLVDILLSFCTERPRVLTALLGPTKRRRTKLSGRPAKRKCI